MLKNIQNINYFKVLFYPGKKKLMLKISGWNTNKQCFILHEIRF